MNVRNGRHGPGVVGVISGPGTMGRRRRESKLFPVIATRSFESAGLYEMRQGLQNGLDLLVRLTSRGQSPYFPKLDSSFCWKRSGDGFQTTNHEGGIEIAIATRMAESSGAGGAVREDLRSRWSGSIVARKTLQ